jgi:prepilin-type N-terminal cleavage/methylation domain-containing protein
MTNQASFASTPLQRQTAFTLIELIVVVVVLGILMAVMLPNFFGASTSVKDASAASYLKVSYADLANQQAQNNGLWPSVESLVAVAASNEPELQFTAASVSGSAAGPKLVSVELTSTGTPAAGVKLTNVSASGTVCTLLADGTTQFRPVIDCGTS